MESLLEIRRGEAGIERFLGQTVIYFPVPLVDRIGIQIIMKHALELFPRREPKNNLPRIMGPFELEGIRFYCFEADSVFDYDAHYKGVPFEQHPRYHVPDELVRRIFTLV